VFLFLSYVVGLWFTLRTHAAIIWQVPPAAQPSSLHLGGGSNIGETARGLSRHQDGHGHEPRAAVSLRDSQLYKRVLGQSLNSVGLRHDDVHKVPPKSADGDVTPTRDHLEGRPNPVNISSLTTEENAHLVRGVAEVAAAAATAAVQDAQRQRKATVVSRQQAAVPAGGMDDDVAVGGEAGSVHGGHDAPNWSRLKSSVILLGATVLYAVIAEILVNTVDVVLENFDVDEKFLGITLFALVPNTTEFLNAISFAMNGNIALSMEIGSAYALQVCLLQIPALVLFSVLYGPSLAPDQLVNHTFSLIFPQWDLVTVILCVFLLSYMYGEGKSNYFKGSILILSYLTVMMGFYFSSYAPMAQDDAQVISMGAGSRGTGYYLRHNQ